MKILRTILVVVIALIFVFDAMAILWVGCTPEGKAWLKKQQKTEISSDQKMPSSTATFHQ